MSFRTGLIFGLLAVSGAVAFAAASDPWTPADLIQPPDLLAQLKSGQTPEMRMVGPRIIYNGGHIAGSSYAGPGNSPAGLDALLKSVSAIAHEAPLLIYCGCCPMDRCPNIRPAFAALKKAGFTNVKVLVLDTNLHTDWTAKGYPVEKGSIPKP
jgi:hypothetical protein